jgi:DNA invertase Pin-like site-specific DNA recombinase
MFVDFDASCGITTLQTDVWRDVMTGKFVAYYRVSTAGQGRSGLGLEAQQRAVLDYLNGGAWDLIGEETEVETGTRADRPALRRALALCKDTGATLVIAKLDRLARNVAFVSALMESGVEFVCCDMPTATRFTIHIMAAVAEQEAEAISSRTKAGLASIQAKLARGEAHVSKAGRTITKLGNPHGLTVSRPDLGAKANADRADAFAERMRPRIIALREQGLSLAQVAEALNAQHVLTARGGNWSPMQVKRVLDRAGE